MRLRRSAFEESGFLMPTFLERSSLLTSEYYKTTFEISLVFENTEGVVHFVVGEELINDLKSLQTLGRFM